MDQLIVVSAVGLIVAMIIRVGRAVGSMRPRLMRRLLVFLIASVAGVLLPVLFGPQWEETLLLYGMALLAQLTFWLTASILDAAYAARRWGVASAWLIGLLVLDLLTTAPSGPWLGWQTVSPWLVGAAYLVWLAVMGGAFRLTVRAFRQAERRPLHRNRLRFWLLGLTTLAIADLLFFLHLWTLAGLVRLFALVLIVYVTTTYQLPDMRVAMRRSSSQLLAVIAGGTLYAAGYLLLLRAQAPALHPVLVGSSLAMILAILYVPLQRGLERILARWASEPTYDPNRMLRDYSLRISHLVELGQLEAAIVALISQVMEIAHGTLYLVDTDEDVIGRPVYQLSSVQGFGSEKLVLGTFAANSPVAAFLQEARRPLTQYDIDLLPAFQDAAETEREWLAGLAVEVYVPIHARGRWIGLLGLGPKLSGNRYYVRDLALLKTLAEQTAVALENARLVADLVQLNHVLKRANADVERANVRLQEAGQLKSDFIGMVTHELRTPFANMAFSLQLLQRTGTDNWMPAQGEALRQLAQEMQAGREMVDNLIKMATFLRKQEALRPAAFDFREVVVEGIRPLQTLAASKDICLHVNGSTGPMPVWADRDRLLDAVHHLVHNAIKFTGAGGEISVRATLEGACVRFEVRDTGVGVAPERLPALWQSFDQVADPHRRSAEGLGLGLALVKHIAVAHQGEVFAHSQVNVGSLFGFTIPAN